MALGWGSGKSLSVNMQNALLQFQELNSCNDPRNGWNGRAKSGMLCAIGPPSGFCRGTSSCPLLEIQNARILG